MSARLTDGATVSRQAVTKHLHALEVTGPVRSRRAGRERAWALRPERFSAVRRCLEDISGGWDETLGRLRAFVEREP